MLGDLLHERHPGSLHSIHYSIEEKAEGLADRLVGGPAGRLENPRKRDESAERRLAPCPRPDHADGAAGHARQKFVNFIDSSLLVDRPNGIAIKRKTKRGGRRRDVRSIVLSDAAIECCVHLHLLPNANKGGFRKLSFVDFIDTLRERYGFFVDIAPPGMSVSNELLQRNRGFLERRLRDLGLLVGVNDAESMKRLRPRFHPDRQN